MILSNVRTDFNLTIAMSNQGHWVFIGLCIINSGAERPLVLIESLLDFWRIFLCFPHVFEWELLTWGPMEI